MKLLAIMLLDSFRTIFLILKYAIKRKLNKFGYILKKSTFGKSRQAVGKKGLGVFGTLIATIGILYFVSLGVFFIYYNTQKVIQLDQFKKIVNQKKIPSSLSVINLKQFHGDLLKKFVSLKSTNDKASYEQERKLAWDDFNGAISSEFILLTKTYQVDLEIIFKNYIETGVCPLESMEANQVHFSYNSPYFSIFYVSTGLVILIAIFTYLGLSIAEIGSLDRYYEWLSYNSLPIKFLYLFRIIENAFSNPMNWFCILPMVTYIYFAIRGPWFIPLAIVLWLTWSIIIGAIQVLFELFFQHYAGIKNGKIFQAICSIIGTMLFLTLSLGNSNLEVIEKACKFFLPMENFWPYIPFFYLPLLNRNNSLDIFSIVVLVVSVATLVSLIYQQSKNLTKEGFVTHSSAYMNKRNIKPLTELKLNQENIHPVLKIEKLMLFRNKQIILISLLTPSLLFAFYYFSFELKEKTLLNPTYISFVAFGSSSYLYLITTFGLVQREVKSLWLVYTLPMDPYEYFSKKIWLWSSFSYFFFVIVYLLYLNFGGEISFEFFCNFFMVLIGVTLFAIISSGIGILGYDPSNTNQVQKVGALYTYLYMYLCGFYTAGLYTDNLFVKMNILILAFTIAFAIKAKVKSSMQYYLDRSIVDNNLTVFEAILFIFFYISILTTVQLIAIVADKEHQQIFLSGIIAVSILLIVLIFTAKSYPEIKKIGLELIQLSKAKLFSLRLYIYLIASLSVAYSYLLIAKKYNFFGTNDIKSEAFPVQYALFAVFLAPVVEEILFRRILFKTMREHFSPLSAILYSSCLFALAHPPSSFVPVFCLGCLSAVLYHQNKTIHQSILLHTFYNFGVFAFAAIA